MAEKPTKEGLAKLIEKEISYDASGGQNCPNCGHEIKAAYYWIDHMEILIDRIARYLGVVGKGRIALATMEAIEDVVGYFYVTGRKNVDAPSLANEIWREVYGE